MAELTIESVPSGAEVQIAGIIIGVTPVTCQIDEMLGLAEFRAECLSGGNVVCSWGVLKMRLEDQTVSRLWWDFTRDERYSIAENSVTNTFPSWIQNRRTGDPGCVGGVGDWSTAMCVPNTMIRCLKMFKDPSPNDSDVDRCYWKDYAGNEQCFLQPNPYELPCHTVSCINHSRTYYHSLAAVQIDKNTDQLGSWCIFQYSDFDIKPGDRQLPYGSTISIHAPYVIQCGYSNGDLMYKSVI